MNIISEPNYKTEEVTLVDIAFSDGTFKQLTVRAADSLTESAFSIQVQFAEPVEYLGINRHHVAWWSKRPHTIKTPIPGKPTQKDGPTTEPKRPEGGTASASEPNARPS